LSLKPRLTAKEIQALRLVNRGLSNEQIANELAITIGTTKWYLHQIFHKLQVHSRSAAAAQARRRRII